MRAYLDAHSDFAHDLASRKVDIDSDRPDGGARWTTELPAPGASASVVDGEVADHTGDEFANQVELVSGSVGPASSKKSGRDPSARWSLASGAMLDVSAAAGGCFWVLTSPEFVEIERDLAARR